MNRWAMCVIGVGLLSAVGGCAIDKSYPAPLGSDLAVNPVQFTISSPGVVLLSEVIVSNPDLGDSGMMLNNIQVAVKSPFPEAIVLIPESAIIALDDDFASDPDEGLGSEAWAVDEAERYFEWTQTDDSIQPDYLETVTDSRGVARVYIYIRALPSECGLAAINVDDLNLDAGEEDAYCEYDPVNFPLLDLETELYFTIGVDADTLTVTVEPLEFEDL